MTQRLYYDDCYLHEFRANVIDTAENGIGPALQNNNRRTPVDISPIPGLAGCPS